MSDEMKSIFQGLNARGKMILPEAATEEQIAAFEKEHTVELPKEYKECGRPVHAAAQIQPRLRIR